MPRGYLSGCRRLAGLWLVLLAAASPLMSAPNRCCPPVKVTEQLWTGQAIQLSDRRFLLADDLGGLYGFWLHDYFRYSMILSQDSGQTWTGPSDPTGNGRDVRGLDAAVSPSGSLVVAYVDDNRLYVRASQDQGRGFGQRAVLADHPDSAILGPRLASGTGEVFAVSWTVYTSGVPGPDDGYYVAVTQNAGGSWGRAFRISDVLNLGSPTTLTVPVPLVTSAAVTAVVSDSGGAVQRILATRTTDGGNTWGPEILVTSPNGGRDLFPVAHCRTSGGHLIVGNDRTLPSGDTVFDIAVSGDHGLTWSDAGLELSEDRLVDEASLTCSEDGRVSFSWFGEDERPRVSLSLQHGVEGSWTEIAGLSNDGVRDHHFRPIHEPVSVLTVLHDDYRDAVTCGQPGTCESIYVDRSCDGGATWLEGETRLDDDTPNNGTHSEDPEVARTPNGWMHVLWTDHAVPVPGSGGNVHYAAVEVPEVPRLWIDIEQTAEETLCDPPAYTLHAHVDPPDLCPAAQIQWWQEDSPIPAAVGADYVVPTDLLPPGDHGYSFVVTCSPPLPCGDLSPEVRIEIPSPGSRVTSTDLDGLLRVEKTATMLRVFWTELDPDPSHHSLYRGTLGTWYDHAAWDCHVERSRSEVRANLEPGSFYYLVSPADCGGEGQVGRSSRGGVRPTAGRGASCGPVP